MFRILNLRPQWCFLTFDPRNLISSPKCKFFFSINNISALWQLCLFVCRRCCRRWPDVHPPASRPPRHPAAGEHTHTVPAAHTHTLPDTLPHLPRTVTRAEQDAWKRWTLQTPNMHAGAHWQTHKLLPFLHTSHSSTLRLTGLDHWPTEHPDYILLEGDGLPHHRDGNISTCCVSFSNTKDVLPIICRTYMY